MTRALMQYRSALPHADASPGYLYTSNSEAQTKTIGPSSYSQTTIALFYPISLPVPPSVSSTLSIRVHSPISQL